MYHRHYKKTLLMPLPKSGATDIIPAMQFTIFLSVLEQCNYKVTFC